MQIAVLVEQKKEAKATENVDNEAKPSEDKGSAPTKGTSSAKAWSTSAAGTSSSSNLALLGLFHHFTIWIVKILTQSPQIKKIRAA